MNKDNCIFCKIATDDLPSTKFYEDRHCYAILDINPIKKGHALVVSKDHFGDLFDLPDDVLARMGLVAQHIGQATYTVTDADGVNLGMNNGKAAGQEIPHAHMHVIPRHEGDGLKNWEHTASYDDGEMEQYKKKIMQQLD